MKSFSKKYTEEEKNEAIKKLKPRGEALWNGKRIKTKKSSEYLSYRFSTYSVKDFRAQIKEFMETRMTEEERGSISPKMVEEMLGSVYCLHQERLHENRMQELRIPGFIQFKLKPMLAKSLVYERLQWLHGTNYAMEVHMKREEALGFQTRPDIMADWLRVNRKDLVGYIEKKYESKGDNAE